MYCICGILYTLTCPPLPLKITKLASMADCAPLWEMHHYCQKNVQPSTMAVTLIIWLLASLAD